MKKSTHIITGLFLMFTSISSLFAQEMSQQDCTVEYNLYKGEVKAKKFESAKTRLDVLLASCPDLSVNIYKYAEKIVDDVIAQGDLEGGIIMMSDIYDQRLEYFPDGTGKVYSDWVSFLLKNGISQEDERIFQYLEKAYKADPSAMSPKNIYMYFDMVLERNKNIDVQKILDTYDDIVDALDKKEEKYQNRLGKLIAKEDKGVVLSKKEAKSKRIAEGVLKNSGIVKSGLDQKIEELLTCDRLVPLYRRDFNENKNNAVWLKRAVSRMHSKECSDDPLYEELAYAYAEADPSSNAYIFLSGILAKNGKRAEAMEMQKKAISLEVDPIKKSKYLLMIAQDLQKRGRNVESRKYANNAIANNPSNGNAYLLIATLYAKSANKCGDSEFSKRMAYVAALDKAKKAKRVDPSIASKANKYIKSYQSNIPTKQMLFSEGIKVGDTYKIQCWIGETVTVQAR